jgi:hypothetical protein
MADKKIGFEERQYFGSNKQTLSLRIFLALFCFTAYYFTDIPEMNGDLLFILGVAILVISVILLFITHLHTRVDSENLILEGFMSKGKVIIPLNSIVSVEKIVYSNYLINNPVYNLHRDGIVKFYSGGKDAVRVSTKSKLKYIIGTHKPEELLLVIRNKIP